MNNIKQAGAPSCWPMGFWLALDRFLAMPSNSSMNRMQGAMLRAFSNMPLTLAAPTPTNTSSNSLPATLKKGTFDSPAIALASSVLPAASSSLKRDVKVERLGHECW